MADPPLGLYVVCDGMGGGNAGDIASTLAVEAIQAHLAEAARHADLPLIGPCDATVSARPIVLPARFVQRTKPFIASHGVDLTMLGWVLPWSPHSSVRKCSPSPMSETAGSISFETGQSKPSLQTIPGWPNRSSRGSSLKKMPNAPPAGTS